MMWAILLVGTGLFLRSLQNAQGKRLSIDMDRVLLAEVASISPATISHGRSSIGRAAEGGTLAWPTSTTNRDSNGRRSTCDYKSFVKLMGSLELQLS
jgi:hypothetical protein